MSPKADLPLADIAVHNFQQYQSQPNPKQSFGLQIAIGTQTVGLIFPPFP